MNQDEVKEQLRGIISEVSEVDEIPDGAVFRDLGIDSMMAVEIIAEVERAFKVTVHEDELLELTHFDAVLALLERKLS